MAITDATHARSRDTNGTPAPVPAAYAVYRTVARAHDAHTAAVPQRTPEHRAHPRRRWHSHATTALRTRATNASHTLALAMRPPATTTPDAPTKPPRADLLRDPTTTAASAAAQDRHCPKYTPDCWDVPTERLPEETAAAMTGPTQRPRQRHDPTTTRVMPARTRPRHRPVHHAPIRR